MINQLINYISVRRIGEYSRKLAASHADFLTRIADWTAEKQRREEEYEEYVARMQEKEKDRAKGGLGLKPKKKCTHCGKQGHEKDTCWELHPNLKPWDAAKKEPKVKPKKPPKPPGGQPPQPRGGGQQHGAVGQSQAPAAGSATTLSVPAGEISSRRLHLLLEAVPPDERHVHEPRHRARRSTS